MSEPVICKALTAEEIFLKQDKEMYLRRVAGTELLTQACLTRLN